MAFSIMLVLLFNACKEKAEANSSTVVSNEKQWTFEKLQEKAQQHLEPTNWDSALFQQDITNYAQYTNAFKSYPLNKSPFPVAKYDYAVSSTPFSIDLGINILKGVRIGEYETAESEQANDQLILMVLSNDPEITESTLVESRNFPYLTAEGMFTLSNQEFDWVFSASPDGYSILLYNMKLFDLRFGKTILIYPQGNQSFLYDQLTELPSQFKDFESYQQFVLNKPTVIRNMLRQQEQLN